MAEESSPEPLKLRRPKPGPPGRGWVGVALVTVALASRPAAAQTADSTQKARADAMFAEGRALLDQGRYKEACAKFELSLALDGSPGTLLNLGNCYEPEGDLVRALATFEQAFIDAQRVADPELRQIWSDAARERIARLGSRVPELTLRGAAPGSTLSLDGHVVASAGRAFRINPGHHVLDVRSPDGHSATRDFDIAIGQRLAINIPPLESAPGPVAAPSPPAVAPTPAPTPPEPPLVGSAVAPAPAAAVEPPPVSPQPAPAAHASAYGPWPWVLAGTGAALVGAGVVTGLAARSKSDQLERECGSPNCDPSLEHLQDSAQNLAAITDTLWITGAVLAGVGVTLFLLDDGSPESGTRVQARCSVLECGFQATGSF